MLPAKAKVAKVQHHKAMPYAELAAFMAKLRLNESMSARALEFTILTAAALGFLGLGPPPPTLEWGRTIAEAREFLPDAWWYALAPGLAIFLTVMGFNLLGDGLRDVLDPRLRRGRSAPDG